jgi:hypothetical protein
MRTSTKLEPLAPARARELARLLAEQAGDPLKGLALDDSGSVTGIVQSNDPRPRHILSDLDVHA